MGPQDGKMHAIILKIKKFATSEVKKIVLVKFNTVIPPLLCCHFAYFLP